MVPALKLATLFLMEPHSVGRWAAILFGARTVIPQHDKRDGRQKGRRYRLDRVPSEQITDDLKASIGAIIDSWPGLIEFSWDDTKGQDAMTTPKEEEAKKKGGVPVCWVEVGMDYRNRLSYQYYDENGTPVPFDQWHLDEREILYWFRLWFRLATTIAHEIMHAAEFIQGYRRIGKFPMKEPYFEDEQSAELGFSFEKSIFGTVPAFVPGISDEYYAFCHKEWPATEAMVKSGTDCWPVPMTFINDISHNWLWSWAANLEPQQLLIPPVPRIPPMTCAWDAEEMGELIGREADPRGRRHIEWLHSAPRESRSGRICRKQKFSLRSREVYLPIPRS
jgi:hypothetical protein